MSVLVLYILYFFLCTFSLTVMLAVDNLTFAVANTTLCNLEQVPTVWSGQLSFLIHNGTENV